MSDTTDAVPAPQAQPLISVLMPAYKHAAFVHTALDSVLQQSWQHLEVIVIDDASPDTTWDVLQACTDPRLRLLRNEHNLGSHGTMNAALQLARGEFIAIINSDDLFLPERLASCYAALQASGADLVGTDMRLMDDDGNVVTTHWWIDAYEALKRVWTDTQDWPATLLAGNVFMTTSNFFFRRRWLEQVGPFHDLRYVLDYEWLLRGLAQGMRLTWVETPLLHYRLHAANTISEHPWRANLECAALLRQYLPALLGHTPTQHTQLGQLTQQWARIEKYLCEIAATQRHEALVAKEAELFPLIHDRDRWIAERDQSLRELHDHMAERDTYIATLTQKISEKDRQIALLSRALSERLQRPQHTPSIPARPPGFAMPAPTVRPTQAPRAHPGRPQRLLDLAHLQDWLEPRLGRVRCVSFDVFDTLLARCIEPPETVHVRLAQLVAEKLPAHTPEHILAVRRAAEQEQRQAMLAQGLDHECHHDALVQSWVTQLVGQRDVSLEAFIHTQERRLEALALAAKPGAAALLNWLRSRKVRVIAVSDMYLGHDHVCALLDTCGLGTLIDQVYVSSEFGLGKYSGRLHSHVLALEGLQPDQVVHVGDNLVSDMRAPLRLGIEAVFLDEKAQRLRRRHQALSARMARLGGVWSGRHFFEAVAVRQRMLGRSGEAGEPFFHHYGRDVLGPAFATFTLALTEKIVQQRPDKIFFLARDGYLFMRLYERWCALQPATQQPWPEPVYVYASRRVVAMASMADGLRPEQAIVALYNPKQQGLLSVLKTFGLAPEDFQELALAHGFTDLAAPLHNWQDPRLLAFLADEQVQAGIRPIGQAARARLQAYFEQQGFFACQRAALVDIGWNGTIQKFLHDSFGQRPDYPEVHGWYLAFVAAMHGDFGMGERIEGLLLDARRGDTYERAPMDFEEIFEQAARAAEGTTLGYEEQDGRIVARLKSDDSPDRLGELACNPLIAQLQAGVLAHLEDFHAIWSLTGYQAQQLKPYVQALLERAVVYPTPEEVAQIGQLVHTEDFGHDHTLDIAPPRVGWLDLLRPRQLYRQLRPLAWKFAAFAHFPSDLPAWLFRLVHLKKRA